MGHIAQVRPQVFKLEKTLKITTTKKTSKTLQCLGGQADFGKLELNSGNHGGNCQRLSAVNVINLKHDQFEIIAEIL